MPRLQPDFTEVFASTPVWPKNLYELVIDKISGQAYDRENDDGTTTQVRSVILRPKIAGVFDSKGKLKTELDGAAIDGQPTENIKLYIHSRGAMEYSKRIMMAILGYNRQEEQQFNDWIKTVDLAFDVEEREDGGGYDVTLGEGWHVLEGKHVKAQMSKGSFKNKDDVTVERQEFDNFFPVSS